MKVKKTEETTKVKIYELAVTLADLHSMIEAKKLAPPNTLRVILNGDDGYTETRWSEENTAELILKWSEKEIAYAEEELE